MQNLESFYTALQEKINTLEIKERKRIQDEIDAFREKNQENTAKLTKEQVVEIYQSIDSIDNLIIKYNVSKSTIRGIKNGSIWNIYTNHKKQPKKHQKLTNEIKQHIKNIRLNGERICNIQKLYPNIPKSTIQSFIEKYCDTGQSDD